MKRRMPKEIVLDHAGIVVRFAGKVRLKRREAFWRTMQRLLNAQQARWATGAHRQPSLVDPISKEDRRITSTMVLTPMQALVLLPDAKKIPSDWSGRLWQDEIRFSPCSDHQVEVLDELRYRFDGDGITWDMGAEMSHGLRTRQTGLGFSSKPKKIKFTR